MIFPKKAQYKFLQFYIYIYKSKFTNLPNNKTAKKNGKKEKEGKKALP